VGYHSSSANISRHDVIATLYGCEGTKPFSRAEGWANAITVPKSESSFQDVVGRHKPNVSLSRLQN